MTLSEWHYERMMARSRVAQAVKRGALPPVAQQPCERCGAPAKEYHHYKGYEPEHWLSVVPVCAPCHKREPEVGRPNPHRPWLLESDASRPGPKRKKEEA